MYTLFKNVLFLVIIFAVFGCKNDSGNKNAATNSNLQAKIYYLTPSEFKEKSINHVIVDIRTPQEFNQGHIEKAININFYQRDFLDQISKLDKSEPIFIYCRTGSRTSSAAKRISNLGFVEVNDLKGGIINWIRNNNQIIK